jgi:hypothetical protein
MAQEYEYFNIMNSSIAHNVKMQAILNEDSMV